MRVLCSGKVKDNKKSTRFRKKIEYFFRYIRFGNSVSSRGCKIFLAREYLFSAEEMVVVLPKFGTIQ